MVEKNNSAMSFEFCTFGVFLLVVLCLICYSKDFSIKTFEIASRISFSKMLVNIVGRKFNVELYFHTSFKKKSVVGFVFLISVFAKNISKTKYFLKVPFWKFKTELLVAWMCVALSHRFRLILFFHLACLDILKDQKHMLFQVCLWAGTTDGVLCKEIKILCMSCHKLFGWTKSLLLKHCWYS